MLKTAEPSKKTLYPVVVGASVLAIKYKDGVMMMADTLCSFGGLARYKNVQRIRKVSNKCMMGASGEFSDFQYILQDVNERTMDDFNEDDSIVLSAKEYQAYLSRVMYWRRCRCNPLWNDIVVAGHEEGKNYLGLVDMYGTSYEENLIGTGFGSYIAVPIMRKAYRENFSENEARELLKKAMTVVYYRHCRTINKFQIATITANGVDIGNPFELETKWDYERFVTPLIS